MWRITGAFVAGLIVTGLAAGAFWVGRASSPSHVVAPTAAPASPSIVATADQAPAHDALQVLQAARAQGFGSDEGCTSSPTWVPQGITRSDGRSETRIWALPCFRLVGGQPKLQLCALINDLTLQAGALFVEGEGPAPYVTQCP